MKVRIGFSIKENSGSRTGRISVEEEMDQQLYRALQWDQSQGRTTLPQWIDRNLQGRFIHLIDTRTPWTVVDASISDV